MCQPNLTITRMIGSNEGQTTKKTLEHVESWENLSMPVNLVYYLVLLSFVTSWFALTDSRW